MLHVTLTAVDRVRPLRREVLRVGQGFGAASFGGDDAAETLHVAAIDGGSGRVVGCASVMVEPHDGIAHRLRGMAVDPAWQGRGVGTRVLRRIEDELRRRGADAMWCKARVPAVGFYERQGWRCVGEAYDVPPHGPHRTMVRAFGAPSEPLAASPRRFAD